MKLYQKVLAGIAGLGLAAGSAIAQDRNALEEKAEVYHSESEKPFKLKKVMVYVLPSWPKFEKANEEIHAINDMLGTNFDDWEVVATAGIEATFALKDPISLDLFLEYSKGHIGGTEDYDLGKAKFKQEKEFFNGGAIVYYNFRADKRFNPYVGAGVAYGVLKADTTLELRGSLNGDVSADFSDGSHAIMAYAGFDLDLSNKWTLSVVPSYIWATYTDNHVPVKDSMNGDYTTSSEVDSIGPGILFGIGYRFDHKKR